MLLIQRKGELLLSYNPTTDRYAIMRYDGKLLDESNNRSLIDALWRKKVS